MSASPRRIAANRANAARSTGPRTPEGKARSSQNARKPPFNPDPFTIVRIEDRVHVARLVAEAVATYHPVNSQERAAVERIALAQHSMLRMYALEAGFFSNCADVATSNLSDPPLVLTAPLAEGIPVAREQHRSFWLASGLIRFQRQSNVAATLLRFQAQAERLYRRAVEDFHRLLKLRKQLPPEKIDENEPIVEPMDIIKRPDEPTPWVPTEAESQAENEANADHWPQPAASPPPARDGDSAPNNPRPVLVPGAHPPGRPPAKSPPGAKSGHHP